MNRKHTFSPGEFYHLYNRGVEKRETFLSQRDYKRFLALLFLCNGATSVNIKSIGENVSDIWEIDRGQPLVNICTYCLMPNHFHLLIQARGDGNVARFMQKLMTGYTMYLNKLNERTGSLFQGTYQSVHANTDRYLKYLFAYIHLNPLKLIEPRWKEIGLQDNRRAETYLQQYPYSSFQDFLGNKRPEKNIIALASFPLYFDSKEDLKKNVFEWMSYQKNGVS